MNEQSVSEISNNNLQVAPIISDDKLNQFKFKVISTLSGLASLGHYEDYSEMQDKKVQLYVLSLTIYILIPALIIIPSSLITAMQLYKLVILLPMIISPILAILVDYMLNQKMKIYKYGMVILYCFLWASHCFIVRRIWNFGLITLGEYVGIGVMSIVSVVSSAATIGFAPVREFSASTFHFEEINLHSTLYMRLIVPLPLLLTQIAIFYTQFYEHYYIVLPYLSFIVSLSFILWIFGWLSSLYNTVMFITNNLLNCLVFGEKLAHSGQNYRGRCIWWSGLLSLGLNVLVIGLNLLLVKSQQRQGKLARQIRQNQHVFLVCAASFTSLVVAGGVYIKYRVGKESMGLVRFGRDNLSEGKGKKGNDGSGEGGEQKWFFGHRQVLMVVISIAIPVMVSLLIVYGFNSYFSGDSNVSQSSTQNSLISKNMMILLLLGLDSIIYIFQYLLKQLTRVRSKYGCSLSLFYITNYKYQIQFDLVIKLILKVTGALAVLVLVSQISDVDGFVNEIVMGGGDVNPRIEYFVRYVLMPVVIYRGYKRSQNYEHWFHISVVISFILTITKFGQYYSIFVVLVMPNFPQNPLKLLFVSPFTIPSKLVHKHQNCYRIGYLGVNIITFFIYVGTCGIFQLSMVFGLPMYWCVIPSVSCEQPKMNRRVISSSSMAVADSHQLQQHTNTQLILQNRSTPQHNLYGKIISQIPFDVFRNRQCGYYILRINKYIILVQIINQYYGLFQLVYCVGLEVQEITTCHAKQGQVIDYIIESNWGGNSNKTCCTFRDVFTKIIRGQSWVQNAEITNQNQIQLVGVVQNVQFYQLFKKCLIKALIYYYDKMLKKNKNYQLTNSQQNTARELLEELQRKTSKGEIDQYFPYEYLENNGFSFRAKLREMGQKINIKKKLPPISKKPDNKFSMDLLQQFADLIDDSHIPSKNHQQNNDNSNDQHLKIKQKQTISSIQDSTTKIDIDQLNMVIIIYGYEMIIGKINYLNQQQIYKMLKNDGAIFNQFNDNYKFDFIAQSIGCALKITIDKYLNNQINVVLEDIIKYDKNQYVGVMESMGFSEAIENNKDEIWGVGYNNFKKGLQVKRVTKSDTSIYMLNLANNAVQAVWNNLRFELLYVANDNDQRYSIQTHEHLLRNLLVESCEQPYGYAGYYSQVFLNL